jgi:hypothetical protein
MRLIHDPPRGSLRAGRAPPLSGIATEVPYSMSCRLTSDCNIWQPKQLFDAGILHVTLHGLEQSKA